MLTKRVPTSYAEFMRTDGGDDPSGRERRVVGLGVGLALAAALAQSALHLVNLAFFDLEINAINVDSDSGAFTWASSVATFGAALAIVQLWLLVGRGRPDLWMPAVAGVLAFFSLDDLLFIHERISALENEFAGIEHFSRLFWPLVFMPLLGASFVGLWVLTMRMRPLAATAVRAGLALLVAAILMEMASPALFALGFDHGDLGYELETVAEEGAELAGWMLVATGLVAAVFREAAALGREAREPA